MSGIKTELWLKKKLLTGKNWLDYYLYYSSKNKVFV